jgi:hypothetical protein
MSLNKGKHNVQEIEGIRCTVVETGLSADRSGFLKTLLVLNGYDVKMEKEKAKDGTELETIILGVTDILFNPVVKVYQNKLHREDGQVVTPAYWNQWIADPNLPYWMVSQVEAHGKI